MLKDFKTFILRGNVIDLAVAVVIGAAFNSVVQSFVRDFITPLITGVIKKGALSGTFTIAHRVTLNWGDFISVLLSFIIEAFLIFIFIVRPLNKLLAFSERHKKPLVPNTKKCPECLSEIAIKAKRCAFCTTKFA